jgi:hypothetical protein
MDSTSKQQTVRSHCDTRVLVDDKRLLANLNCKQHYHTTSETYFGTVQTDIKPHMRKETVSWMHEVCEEECCECLVVPLAAYILDRFLCEYAIKRNMLQLVACVCMFLSSKIFDTDPLKLSKLVYYTDNSLTSQNLIVSHQT